MEDLGPISVLYCWQSLLLAFGVSATTNYVKQAIDWKLGGKDARANKIFVNRVILPALPLILGALGGLFVPIHPDALTLYLTEHAVTGTKYYIALAAYGGAVGQFSDYVWHRYSGLKDDLKEKKEIEKQADEAKVEDKARQEITNAPPPSEG